MKFLILLLVLIISVLVATKISRKIVKPKHLIDKFLLEKLENNISKKKINTRIVGGKRCRPHQFPYQVALLIDDEDENTNLCGGSLIAPNFVLTAAHCLYGSTGALVYVGAHDYTEDDEEMMTNVLYVRKNNFIIHENYDSKMVYNDVALIQLGETVEPSAFAQFIKLDNDTSQNYEDCILRITGWGLVSDNETLANELQYANTRVLPYEKCKKVYENYLRPANICTAGKAGISTCTGDSGGPLVDIKTNIQIGVVSFGTKLCEIKMPSVYTRVSFYYNWIQHHLEQNPPPPQRSEYSDDSD